MKKIALCVALAIILPLCDEATEAGSGNGGSGGSSGITADCLTGTWTLHTEEDAGDQYLIDDYTLTINADGTYEELNDHLEYDDNTQTVYSGSRFTITQGEWFIDGNTVAMQQLASGSITDFDSGVAMEDVTEANARAAIEDSASTNRSYRSALCNDTQFTNSSVYYPENEGQAEELNGNWRRDRNSHVEVNGEYVLREEEDTTFTFDSAAGTLLDTEIETEYYDNVGDSYVANDPPIVDEDIDARIWEVVDADTIRLANCDNNDFTGCGDLASSEDERDYTFIDGYLILSYQPQVYERQ